MVAFQIAWRFLTSGKGQTILITLGIAIGVSVQVFIGSLVQGLQADLVNTTIGSSAHIRVRDADRFSTMSDDRDVFLTIDQFDDQIIALTKVLEGPANVLSDAGNDPVFIRGFDIERANAIYAFDDRLVLGQQTPNNLNVWVGKGLYDNLDLSLNAPLELFFPSQTTFKTVTVIGVLDFRVTQLNDTWIVTDLDSAKMLFDNDGLSAYEMQINDVFKADVIAEQLQEVLGLGYRVDEWKSQNAELLSGLEGQSLSSIMIQVFVLVSVVLGIASVLAITVLQKSKQIGILKAMGISDRQASFIFLYEGLILGILGALLGVLFGLLLGFSFTQFALNPEGDPVVPLLIRPSFIALSAMFAVLASVIAALVPARRSASLSVIEVIRNG